MIAAEASQDDAFSLGLIRFDFVLGLGGSDRAETWSSTSSSLELRFDSSSASGEPLAQRSDQNKFFGHFSEHVFGIFLLRSRAGGLGSG